MFSLIGPSDAPLVSQKPLHEFMLTPSTETAALNLGEMYAVIPTPAEKTGFALRE